MVRRLLLWCEMLIVAAFLFALPLSATDSLPDFSRPMSEFYAALPDDIRQSLPEGLLTPDGPDAEKLVQALQPDEWLMWVREWLYAGLPGAGQLLGKIVLLCILSTLICRLAESFGRSKMISAVQILTALFVALALLQEEQHMLETVSMCLQRLGVTVDALLAVLGLLFATGGNPAVAASGCGGLMALFAVLENLFAALMIPLLAATLGVAVPASLPIGRRLCGVLAAIKRMVAFLLGFSGVLFSAVFGLQTVLAAGADSVASRTVKFAVGNAVPVIGGVMGDTVRTVGAGLEYLKDTVGILGVLLTLLLVLPPILQILLHRAVLLLGQSVAELLECPAEMKLMREFSTVCGWLLALVCACAAAFIFALVLFVQISVSIALV